MARIAESHLVFKVFALLLVAAITTAAVVLLLLRRFAPDSAIRDARAIWHAAGLHLPNAAGFLASCRFPAQKERER